MAEGEVRTAARIIDILEEFGRSEGPLSLSDLARRARIPVSSCHGLVRTLQSRGYIYMLDGRKLIYPTPRMLALAEKIARSDPVIQSLTPSLERLRDATQETIIVAKREGDEAVYLVVLESPHTVRFTADPGERRPLYWTGTGKAILGALQGEKLEKALAGCAAYAEARGRSFDRTRLLGELKRGQRNGYFAARGENVPDVMSIATHIQVGIEALAIAVSGPIERMSRARTEQVARLLAFRKEWTNNVDPGRPHVSAHVRA